ncbi:hypothetical protein H1230_29630 [Paenibacillus sp. 19GGS1-52]|uniref:E2/UBC family protein n=1 Tax=Paenibacillus sp. 19GGS1-52 TaxID=2758563 RepID=UPI001EFA7BB1|nr:E2/UBC family protein [Paenibacillus sp. 19GGS1-52]ULO07056.1 hypothetical protein H1230_29630 [Paenibacillus sp. 19GGS1-52]
MTTNNVSKYAIHITIGSIDYKLYQLSMTGTAIKQLAVADTDDYDLHLEVEGPDESELIPDEREILLIDDMTFFLKHRFNPDVIIIIDAVTYTAPKHVMTGREIKQLANIPMEYALFMIPTARADIQIADDQVVYLITDAQFVSMKSNINNGNILLDATAILPQREISYLTAQGYQYELHRNPMNPNETYLVLPNFDLGENYTPQSVKLLLKIPAGFPTAEMDMFWVHPAVHKKNGQAPATVSNEPYLGCNWQRFSRHRDPGTWNPVVGGLRAHFTFIAEALRKGE